MNNTFKLRLYVTGQTARTRTAIARLEEICRTDLRGRYQLEIIDVLENPARAEADRVMATPTLIKELPPPLRRVIGDLTNTENVLLGLDLEPAPSEET